jgi:hypothetical protein
METHAERLHVWIDIVQEDPGQIENGKPNALTEGKITSQPGAPFVRGTFGSNTGMSFHREEQDWVDVSPW